jgi:integrase
MPPGRKKRQGELAGLHVEDLDFKRGVINVRRSVWCGEEVTTKTKKGYRAVWIDSATVAMIRRHLGSRTSGRAFQTRVMLSLFAVNKLR